MQFRRINVFIEIRGSFITYVFMSSAYANLFPLFFAEDSNFKQTPDRYITYDLILNDKNSQVIATSVPF